MARIPRLVAVAFVIAACSKSSEPRPSDVTAPTQASTPSKDPAKARALIGAGAVVIDVRTPEEFAEDHLPQATNIPIDDFAQRITEVATLTGGDKSKPVVVHCAKGSRARKAKEQLESAGYTQVVNGGGLDDVR
jgi:rhodanese-related sulfurtransferase